MDNNQGYHNQETNGMNYNGTNTNGTASTGNVNNMQNQQAGTGYQNGQAIGNGGCGAGYQNQGYQSNPYHTSPYGSQSGYQNQSTYQNRTSYQQGAGGYGNQGNYFTCQKPEKAKTEKKKSGFGKTLAKCVALALVFGLVSGGVFSAVYYTTGRVTGANAASSNSAGTDAGLTISDTGSTLGTTGSATTYVATSVADLVEEAMPSIVAITNMSETQYQSFWGGQSQTYESTSAGSGIIVSQDDTYLYIATNNHVVDGAKSLTVTFANDTTVSAEIKGTDPSTDLAVVKVELTSIDADTMGVIKTATIGDSDALRVGDTSIAIGNALGYGQSVTTGSISALNREVSVADSASGISYTAELIQTDAAINPGNSGGALLNAAGEVIGINSVKYSDTSVEGIGYAIPMKTATPIIEDLITKEKVDVADSAYLGVAGVDVTSDVAATYNMPAGVYVAQVMDGSAAATAGIQKGDIITSFDGKAVTTMEGLSSTMEYYAAGTTVDIVLQRADNGQYTEQTISVTLGTKN